MKHFASDKHASWRWPAGTVGLAATIAGILSWLPHRLMHGEMPVLWFVDVPITIAFAAFVLWCWRDLPRRVMSRRVPVSFGLLVVWLAMLVTFAPRDATTMRRDSAERALVAKLQESQCDLNAVRHDRRARGLVQWIVRFQTQSGELVLRYPLQHATRNGPVVDAQDWESAGMRWPKPVFRAIRDAVYRPSALRETLRVDCARP